MGVTSVREAFHSSLHTGERVLVELGIDPARIIVAGEMPLSLPSNQPNAPAARMTTGNGTAKNARAMNATTASPISTGLVMALRLTRTTAWRTMAITAGR